MSKSTVTEVGVNMPKNTVTAFHNPKAKPKKWPHGTLLVLPTPQLSEPAYYMVTTEKNMFVNLGTGVLLDTSGWDGSWHENLREVGSVLIERN